MQSLAAGAIAGHETLRLDAAPMSLARVLGLLRLMAAEPAGVSLSSLHQKLGAPKTSVHALLRGLVEEGYAQRDGATYRLGPQSFVLGAALVSARSLAAIALPFLEHARARSGETVVLAVIERHAKQLTYVEVVESEKLVRYSVPVGTTRPLYATSAGRVLLAYQDPAWLDEYLSTVDLRPLTPKTLKDRAKLAQAIERARALGHASTLGEVTKDVAGFAAPVFDHEGRVDAAIIVAAPLDRGRAAADRLTAAACEAAASLSEALGYIPRQP
ncbi:IclR family transcriptional regulator [Ramlibacter albus]|uniref:IclR family transcriptional regulator n=1 Tax=Ramlibacter albus TaxID=2079448 RepID=A0A923M2X9_9BURK|nr:IclR family transcriptional regulator [Ramlibacter albus]MBC5762901.1 IclR family transcriptional regulator [Ramlibacter albus]